MERLRELKSAVDAERVIMRGYRVTIPKRFREKLGMVDGSVLQVKLMDDEIIIRVRIK